MAVIARTSLEFDAAARLHGGVWSAVALACTQWIHAQGLAPRDTVLLVPFAQLLSPARAAFARLGGWPPRVETTQTLAASLGPPPPLLLNHLSFDPAVDRLAAERLLRAQPWGQAWARRDARGFEQAVGQVALTAQEMAKGAAAVPPSERAAHWERARLVLGPQRGPGDTERRLARVALEWAALTFEPLTDRLFALRPAAWIAIQAGGAEPVIESLMAHSSDATHCLILDADASPAAPFERALGTPSPAHVVCDSFEHEAQSAAAQVLSHLQRGEQPVALIAQDRVLVRRVRALLERAQVALVDETGWKLSTTRAAGQVMSLLRVAAPRASSDALLEWLKNLDTWPGIGPLHRRVDELESACRRQHVLRVDALERLRVREALQPFIAELQGLLDGLAAAASLPPARWLEALARALHTCGALAQLQSDEAGRQVLKALHLDAPARWHDAAGTGVMDWSAFAAWIDATLEGHTFHPAPTDRSATLVVITPLARAMLRPFGAIVFPGADDSRLGAPATPHPLLPDALLVSLGIASAAQQREKELLAFAQIAQARPLTLLRRRVDGGNPLGDSPLVERLALALARQGQRLAEWLDPRPAVPIDPLPVMRPAPSAVGRLPLRLSASGAEALRDCPYRFYAQQVLRLRESEELDDAVEKRDFGTWLHAVLHAFHATRTAGPASDEEARLRELGRQHQAALGLVDEQFLPFEASFEAFVPRYIAWLHERDAQGSVWRQGEQALEIQPPQLGGVVLHGVIDRVDEVREGVASVLELIDYKTGNADALRQKLKQPLEDTQLAFYAALMRGQGEAPLRAIYLPLDGTKALVPLLHPDVDRSAQALVDGLGADFARMRAGAGLPALGEGRTCEHCDARGLCRRDHWSEEQGA
jgi:ATP-dependent helicase/nuclease subunit B